MERYNVKLGPVVGKIDSGTVRILLECDNTLTPTKEKNETKQQSFYL